MNVITLCVLLIVQTATSLSLIPVFINICGPEKEINLDTHGDASSNTVTLNPPSPEENKTVCKLRITAPKTHVVNLQFIDDGFRSNETGDPKEHVPCTMSIFLPDNTRSPFWKGDPCASDTVPDVDLLTNDFKILWYPPPKNSTQRSGRKFVLTAVGSGSVCKEPFQHTCMRIGRIPMLCISDHLLCDGHQNCPKSSTTSDEDKKLCKIARNAWENFVVELYKKYRPPIQDGPFKLNTNDSNATVKWQDWQLVQRTTVVYEQKQNATETISTMLNKYGPWGYLMLGLLICGTVLFFCGLWECCCRRPKQDVEPPSHTSQPTTVLVMDCEQNERAALPPNYDELDLPPSYTTLFPTIFSSISSILPNNNNNNNSNSNNKPSTSSLNSDRIEENVVDSSNINSNNNEAMASNASVIQETDHNNSNVVIANECGASRYLQSDDIAESNVRDNSDVSNNSGENIINQNTEEARN